jgi:hypothetical protein
MTLLVFWNPGCGFCAQTVDRLGEIDAARRGDGLLVISTGTPVANRRLASVLLEDAFATGTALGVTGTPSAVLVDERRAPISPVAVGANAVFASAEALDPALSA